MTWVKCKHCKIWKQRSEHYYVFACAHCGWEQTEELRMDDGDLLSRMCDESQTNHRINCAEYRYRAKPVMALPGGFDD